MEAVAKARQRLKRYPILIAECHEPGAKYAACVLSKPNLRKNDCQTEFKEFKTCLMKVVAKYNTRL